MKAPSFTLAAATLLVGLLGCLAEEPPPEKIPVTTSSEEARRLYVEGRDLHDKVRRGEARELYLKAIALDSDFALAHLDLASVSTNGKEFFENVATAVSLADQVSSGERQMILAFDAGMNGRPAEQFDHISKLVELYPGDERARTILGNWYFGRHEWKAAIEQYRRANEFASDFAGPYNQLGYAYRYLERWDEAEAAFKKYIQLLPNEPNPYDSYAEMLMKMGRFEESIASYEKALEIDPSFAPSYVGIGNDYIFLGEPAKARATFGRLYDMAGHQGMQREALVWTAASYVHEGNIDAALEIMQERYAIAEKAGDTSNLASDLGMMGMLLVEVGRPEEAREKFDASMDMVELARIPETVKVSARRNNLYNVARVQLAEGSVDEAKATLDEYRGKVMERKALSEMRAVQHLDALVAFAEGRLDDALKALGTADRQDPRILLLEARILHEKGDDRARAAFERAANFNGLHLNYALVRRPAQEFLASTLPN